MASFVLALVVAAQAAGQVTFPDLIHRWTGDGTLEDSAGSADGTAHGAVGFVRGKFGQAFDIDAGEFVTFGTSTCNVGTADFTISFWVRLDAAQTAPLLGKRATCLFSEMIEIRAVIVGDIAYELAGEGGANYASVSGDGTVTDGAWHHVACRRQGLLLTSHIDGCVAGSDTTSGLANFSNTTEFTLGKSPCIGTADGTTPLAGAMDEIQVYLRALSDSEIAALADRGDGSADLNQSGTVDAADLAILLGAWGPCAGCCAEDLNADGVVNAGDLAVLLGAWTA